MTMDRIEVITSVERRRRWSAAEKARLVAAMNEPDAVVTEIARSAGVVASLLYRWRRRFAAERETTAFVPVRVFSELNEAGPRPRQSARHHRRRRRVRSRSLSASMCA